MSKNSSIAIVAGVAIAVAVIASVFAFSAISNDSVPMDVPDEVTQVNIVPPEEKIIVLTSFYPYHEFTKNVAGDFAEVKQFMPAGVEAHDWEPRAQEIQSLLRADVFVYNGLGMESYVDQIMESGEFDNVLFVKASEGVELIEFEDDHAGHDDHDDHAKEEGHDDHDDHDSHAEEFYEEIALVIEEFEHGHMTESQSIEAIEEILHEHEGDGHDHGAGAIEEIEHVLHEIEDGHIGGPEGLEEIHHLVSGEDVHDDHAKHDDHEEDGKLDHTYDPHIWLDPILAKAQVMTIADHLQESDPAHAEIYHDNAISYANQLDQLDQEIRSDVSSCAKDTFVPFHNAFSYFAERYDLNTLAVIQEFSPETPVTAKDIEELIHFAEDNDIKYFFTEENRNPKLAERLATELGGDILLFSPLESLSENDDPNITYFDKMRQNIGNLKIALECN